MVKEMYITINDVNIHYECFGQGKEIVFIPGNGTNFKYMIKLAKLLSKEYKVYLLDRRGQGKSSLNCKLSYELNAKDVYEFMKKLNILKAHIFGHSGGATIAMLFALENKDMVDKLILCSGATSLKGTNSKEIKKWNMYQKLRLINPKVLNMVLEQPDITNRINKITAKTLVLAATKDIITKEQTQTIASNINNSILKIYNNETHSSYIINAKCYNDVMSFLKEEYNG